MENHRRTPNNPSTFDRDSNLRRTGDRPAPRPRYQNRDERFQSRGERAPRPDGFQSRDDRFGKRPSRFGPRNDRNDGKDGFAPKGKVPAWKEEPKIKIVSDLQVTDGKSHGKYLKNSTSAKFTVTPRRLREAMFKILFRRVRARRFLDLCAGCGMIGIEAISRGAIVSTFVERSSKMCSFIKKNMEALEIKTGHGEVVEIELGPFLKRIAKRKRQWDVVYLDHSGGPEFDEAMKYLSRGTAITVGGTLAVEHPSEIFLPERSGVLRRWRVIVQGEKAISFFERQ